MNESDKTKEQLIKEIQVLKQENDSLKKENSIYCKEKEDCFRTVCENSTTGIYFVENGQLGFVNQMLCDMFGYSKEELIGQSPAIFVHPNDHNLFLENIRRRASGEISSIKYEILCVGKNGDLKNILVYGGVITFNNQRIPIGSMIDITESKKNEERLFKLNRLYAVISQVNQAIVHIKDRQKLFEEICSIIISFGKFKLAWIGLIDEQTHICKPAACSGDEDGYLSIAKTILAGDISERQNLIGRAVHEGVYIVFQDANNEPLLKPLRVEAIKRGFQSVIVLPIKQAGRIIGSLAIYASEKNFFDEQEVNMLNEVVGDINFALDTIEVESLHQKAKLELENSEKQLRMLFDNMTNGFMLFEVIFDHTGKPIDHRLIDANQEIEKKSILLRNEEIGKTSKQLSFKIPNHVAQKFYQVAITREPIQYERFNESMGRFYDVRVFSPFKGQFALLLDDITQRKQTEKELHKSKALLRSVIDSTTELVWIVDAEHYNLIDWNPIFEKYSSMRGLQIKAGDAIGDFFREDPISAEMWKQYFIKTKELGSLTIEHQSRITDRPFLLTLNLLWLDNEIFGISVFAKDITQLKNAQGEAISAKHHFQTVFENAPIGMAVVDIVTGKFYNINEKFINIAGKSREDLLNSDWMQLSIPDKLHSDLDNMYLIRSGESNGFQDERHYFKPDGTLVWMKINVTPIWEEGHSCTKHLCMIEDITKEKKMLNDLIKAKDRAEKSETSLKTAQKELQRSEKFLRDIQTISKTGGWEYQVKTKKSFWTPEIYRIYEISPNSEIDHLHLSLSLYAPSDSDKIEEAFNRCINEGIGYDMEFNFTTINGHKRWARMIAHPIIEDGQVVKLIGSFADITDRKKIENELLRAKAEVEENESRLKQALETGQFGVWDFVVGDKSMHWNERMFELTGVDPNKNDWNKETWTNYIVREDLDRCLQNIEKAFHGGEEYNDEIRFLKNDGSVLNIRLNAKIYRNEKGKPLHIIGIVKDITKNKIAEKALQESEQRYRNLFQKSMAVLLLVDSQSGEIVDANPAACQYYGWSREELLKMKIQEINMLNEEQVKKEMSHANLEKRNYFVFKHRLADDSVRFVEVYSSPLEVSSRNLLYSIIHDITDRKNAEDALLVAKGKAEESDRLKSAFLANMSHEIRTPLNSIIGFSELLLDPFFDQEQQKSFVESIQHNGNNLLTIISDIMDVSKIEACEIQFYKKQLVVTELLNSIFREFRFEANKKGLELKLNNEKLEAETIICSDADRIRQILTNLLSNALKFTEKGYIEIGAQKRIVDVLFFIKDTGIGIAKESHEFIFERFRQVESAFTRKYGGNGIGLTIAKQLTELLGGTMWVESEQGDGATFFFTIPAIDI